MKRLKLTRQERAMEDALVRGEYKDVSKTEFEEIARALAAKRKDAVLNIRINRQDLDSLKAQARRMGVKYQTFIAEVLHRVARRSDVRSSAS